MPTKIRILPEQLCNQIAAGEVVERPASVVKELLENALDAGATEIVVEIEGGGRRLIRVTDNGCGMGKDDLFLCLERHATSKIATGEDLFRLQTLGFRGEALPSIAAVSRLTLRSRNDETAEGWELYAEGGTIRRAVPSGGAIGTSVEVRDLFFNTPARRKFLRKEETELGHIAELVTRLAFSSPGVRFRLLHQHKILIDAPRHPRLADRIALLLGRPIHDALCTVSAAADSLSLDGFISRPELHRAASDMLYSYINGRFIRDRVVQHAILEGVRNLVPRGRYPVGVLFLAIPPGEVDVNVHPTKHEVRFSRQAQVHDFIATAIRSALRGAEHAPAADDQGGADWSSPAPPAAPPTDAAPPAPLRVAEPAVSFASRSPWAPDATAPPPPGIVAPAAGTPCADRTPVLPLADPPAGEGYYSSLRVVGQIARSYIVAEEPGGHLVLVDQHAAHERIGFERLQREFRSGRVATQTLLFPQVIEFGFRDAALIAEALPMLQRLGFDLEPFGGRSFVLKGVPELLKAGTDHTRLLQDMTADLAAVGTSRRVETLCDNLLVTIACHGMVRANQGLAAAETVALLRALDRIDFSATCPHGRPVSVRMTTEEIARMFRRSG